MLHITPLERTTLQLLANGDTDDEIAARLRITAPEIGVRLVALFARMGVTSRAEAIAAARRRGLITATDVRARRPRHLTPKLLSRQKVEPV